MKIWAAEFLPVIYALACNCAIAIICKEVFMRPDPEEDVAGFRTPNAHEIFALHGCLPEKKPCFDCLQGKREIFCTLCKKECRCFARHDPQQGRQHGHGMCLWNGLLATAPGHPYLARAMEQVTNGVRNRFTLVDVDNSMCPAPRSPRLTRTTHYSLRGDARWDWR